MKTASLMAATALLAGCAARDVETPAALTPPAPTYLQAPGGPAPGAWWETRLGDPALRRLMEAALLNSPDLQAATARIAQARADTRLARANRLPTIGGSVDVTASRTSPAQTGFDPGELGIPGVRADNERVLTTLAVDAAWDVDLFGRLRADSRAARLRLSAAGADAAAVRLALVMDVARALTAARAAEARAGAVRASVASARELAEITGARTRAGLVAGIDEVRARGLVAETAAALPVLEGERGRQVAILSTLTGLSPAEIGTLAGAGGPRRFGTPAAGVPSDLLRRRPDIAAALLRLRASDSDVAAAVADRFPRLTITAAVGLVATALGDLFSGDALFASAGPGLAGPILDFGRNRARVDGARARTAEALALYRGTLLDAFGEVEQALALIRARERQLLLLAEQEREQADTASIARIQYRSGLTDFLSVLEAEQDLFRVREARARVEGELADAELALFRAVGGDLEPQAPVVAAGN